MLRGLFTLSDMSFFLQPEASVANPVINTMNNGNKRNIRNLWIVILCFLPANIRYFSVFAILLNLILLRREGYIQPANFKYKRSGIVNVGKVVWFQPIETAGSIG